VNPVSEVIALSITGSLSQAASKAIAQSRGKQFFFVTISILGLVNAFSAIRIHAENSS
jgi:hypothetical protein